MKRSMIIALALCAVLCLTGCGAKMVSVNGTKYPLDTTQLDLNGTQQPELSQITQLQALQTLDMRNTGISPEDYEMLRAALPECEILWSVPLEDGYVDSTSQSVTVAALSEADITALDYLTQLTYVDATACQDYELLVKLQEHRPECKVEYFVTLQDVAYPLNTTALTLPALNPEEMALIAAYLPQVTEITLTGIQENTAELLDMMDSNPTVNYNWETEIYGVAVNAHDTFLDFSGITITDLDALEALLGRLPDLEQVDMCNCGISNEDMDALNRRYPDTKYVWSIKLGPAEVRTDIDTMMPYEHGIDWGDLDEDLLKYLTDVVCVDLGHYPVKHCEFVRYMPKLKYLILADTKVTDLSPLEGAEELIYLEVFLTDVTDFSPLLKVPNLESLNICFTKADPAVIAQLTWVDYIRWGASSPDRTPDAVDRQMLRESLPDTYLEFPTGNISSTGGRWRQQQNYFDMRDVLGWFYMTG